MKYDIGSFDGFLEFLLANPGSEFTKGNCSNCPISAYLSHINSGVRVTVGTDIVIFNPDHLASAQQMPISDLFSRFIAKFDSSMGGSLASGMDAYDCALKVLSA